MELFLRISLCSRFEDISNTSGPFGAPENRNLFWSLKTKEPDSHFSLSVDGLENNTNGFWKSKMNFEPTFPKIGFIFNRTEIKKQNVDLTRFLRHRVMKNRNENQVEP